MVTTRRGQNSSKKNQNLSTFFAKKASKESILPIKNQQITTRSTSLQSSILNKPLKSNIAKKWLKDQENDFEYKKIQQKENITTLESHILDSNLIMPNEIENTPPMSERAQKDILSRIEYLIPNKSTSKSRISSLNLKTLDLKLEKFKKTQQKIKDLEIQKSINANIENVSKNSSNVINDLALPQKYLWIEEIFTSLDRTLFFYHNSCKPCTFTALQKSMNAHHFALFFDIDLFKKIVHISPELFCIKIIKLPMYDSDLNQKYDYQISLTNIMSENTLKTTQKLTPQLLIDRRELFVSKLKTHAKQTHYRYLLENYPNAKIPDIDDIKRFHPKFMTNVDISDWKMENIGSLEVKKINRNSLGSSLLESTKASIHEIINKKLEKDIHISDIEKQNNLSPKKDNYFSSYKNHLISPAFSKKIKERESFKAIESVLLSKESLAVSELEKFIEPFSQRLCMYLAESPKNICSQQIILKRIHNSFDNSIPLKRCEEALKVVLERLPTNFIAVNHKSQIYIKMIKQL